MMETFDSIRQLRSGKIAAKQRIINVILPIWKVVEGKLAKSQHVGDSEFFFRQVW